MLRLVRPMVRPAALTESLSRLSTGIGLRQYPFRRELHAASPAPIASDAGGGGYCSSSGGSSSSSGDGGSRSHLRRPHSRSSSTSGSAGGGSAKPPARDDAAAPLLDFSDTERAYSSKSMGAIVRALVIYQLCTVNSFVRNSEKLYSVAKRVLGPKLVELVVRPTFFAHFCAGEDEQSIRPTIDLLQRFGVGGILDYAAEADVDEAQGRGGDAAAAAAGGQARERDDRKGVFQARVYEYSAEVACDANAKIIHQAISSVHNVLPEGFAAVKLTALGNPLLLERVTTACTNIQRLFRSLDTNGDGLVHWPEFRDGMPTVFGPQPEERLRRVFEELAAEGHTVAAVAAAATAASAAAAHRNTPAHPPPPPQPPHPSSLAVAIDYSAWDSGLITEKMLSVQSLVPRRHDPRNGIGGSGGSGSSSDSGGEAASQPSTAASLFLEATLSEEEQKLFHKMFERIEGGFVKCVEVCECERGAGSGLGRCRRAARHSHGVWSVAFAFDGSQAPVPLCMRQIIRPSVSFAKQCFCARSAAPPPTHTTIRCHARPCGVRVQSGSAADDRRRALLFPGACVLRRGYYVFVGVVCGSNRRRRPACCAD